VTSSSSSDILLPERPFIAQKDRVVSDLPVIDKIPESELWAGPSHTLLIAEDGSVELEVDEYQLRNLADEVAHQAEKILRTATTWATVALLGAARWESRATVGLRAPRSRPRFPGPLRGMTAHWNGPALALAGRPHSECQARWRGIQKYHMETLGWEDIAYTFAVCHHAVAMEGRGAGVRTAANGTKLGNDGWLACFFMVGGSEVPSAAMLSTAEWAATTRFGTSTWNRHKDHKATTCAGTVDRYVSGGRLQLTSSGGSSVDLLRKGDRGTAVREWQLDLRRWTPHALPRFGVDGDFGEETETWTRRFQQAVKIADDGIVGPQTRNAMIVALAAAVVTPPAPPPPVPPVPPPPAPGPFVDVPASHPHAAAFARAKELGLVGGYADGTLRPGQGATRGDLALVAVRIYEALSKD
jgi:hypothetical protein